MKKKINLKIKKFEKKLSQKTQLINEKQSKFPKLKKKKRKGKRS